MGHGPPMTSSHDLSQWTPADWDALRAATDAESAQDHAHEQRLLAAVRHAVEVYGQAVFDQASDPGDLDAPALAKEIVQLLMRWIFAWCFEARAPWGMSPLVHAGYPRMATRTNLVAGRFRATPSLHAALCRADGMAQSRLDVPDVPHDIWRRIATTILDLPPLPGGQDFYADMDVTIPGFVGASLLDYQGFYAAVDSVAVKRAQDKPPGILDRIVGICPVSAVAEFREAEIVDNVAYPRPIPAGTFLFRNSNWGRREHEAYFTPRRLTRETVKHAVAALLGRPDERLGPRKDRFRIVVEADFQATPPGRVSPWLRTDDETRAWNEFRRCAQMVEMQAGYVAVRIRLYDGEILLDEMSRVDDPATKPDNFVSTGW